MLGEIAYTAKPKRVEHIVHADAERAAVAAEFFLDAHIDRCDFAAEGAFLKQKIAVCAGVTSTSLLKSTFRTNCLRGAERAAGKPVLGIQIIALTTKEKRLKF